MAYFFWKHTVIYENMEDEVDEGEQGRVLKISVLEDSTPAESQLKTDIYVSTKVCKDCARFQERVRVVTGIDFKIEVLLDSSKNPRRG